MLRPPARLLRRVRNHRSSASIPLDYRQWELVGVAHETGLDELRGIVGNAIAIAAYRNGTLPFPDGSILVKMAWKHVQSTEFKPACSRASPVDREFRCSTRAAAASSRRSIPSRCDSGKCAAIQVQPMLRGPNSLSVAQSLLKSASLPRSLDVVRSADRSDCVSSLLPSPSPLVRRT